MIPRIGTLVLILVAFTSRVSATPLFSVECLKRISEVIKLDIPDDLGPNAENDSTWTFEGKSLRVCTNSLGDVSHIGYRLFDEAYVANSEHKPLLHFIERYVLENQLHIKYGYKHVDEYQFHVRFLKGDLDVLGSMNINQRLKITETERRGFLLECREGDKVVSMIIPANYQLLKGTNAKELEEVFERDVCRMKNKIIDDSLPEQWADANVYRADSLLMVSTGYYLSDMISSNLYLHEVDGQYRILIDKNKTLRSITNILLTGCADKSLPILLTVDKYGYAKSHLKLSFQQLISYFHMEGCSLYLGVKTSTKEKVTATLFALNKRMAYNHMVSLTFPVSLLTEGKGNIQGTLYAYTPLQNISEDFFNISKKQEVK